MKVLKFFKELWKLIKDFISHNWIAFIDIKELQDYFDEFQTTKNDGRKLWLIRQFPNVENARWRPKVEKEIYIELMGGYVYVGTPKKMMDKVYKQIMELYDER